MPKNNTIVKGLVPTVLTIFVLGAFVALGSLGVWFLFRIFLPWLQYFHVLVLIIIFAVYCAWYTFAKNLREQSKTIRIAELLVLIGIFIVVAAFIYFKITS